MGEDPPQATPPIPRASSLRRPPEPAEPPKKVASPRGPPPKVVREVNPPNQHKKAPVTPPKASPPGSGERPKTPERGEGSGEKKKSPPAERRIEDHVSSSSTGVTTPEVQSEKEEKRGDAKSPSRSPLMRRGFGTKQRKKFEKKYGDAHVRFEEPVARVMGAGEKGGERRDGPPGKGKSKGKGKGKNKSEQKGKGKRNKSKGPGKGSKSGKSGGKA